MLGKNLFVLLDLGFESVRSHFVSFREYDCERNPVLPEPVDEFLIDFLEVMPFGDPLIRFKLTGAQLRHAVKHLLREESFLDGEHNEWYQFSRGFCCQYDRPTRTILSLKMNGKEVQDQDLYTVIMERYHFLNTGDYLDLKTEEIEKNGKPEEAATRTPNVLQEYFSRHDPLKLDGEPRLIIHE